MIQVALNYNWISKLYRRIKYTWISWYSRFWKQDKTVDNDTPVTITTTEAAITTGAAGPSCRYSIPDDVCCINNRSAQCPLIYNDSGDVDVMAIHPNIFKRAEFLTRSMAHLYPNCYANSSWDSRGGSYASDFVERDALTIEPFYFMSEVTQPARWNSFSVAPSYSGCDRNDACDQHKHHIILVVIIVNIIHGIYVDINRAKVELLVCCVVF